MRTPYCEYITAISSLAALEALIVESHRCRMILEATDLMLEKD